MEKALENLSTSALRNLLIDEIKKFILHLDHGSTEELMAMKLHLRNIFDRITEKEREDAGPLKWGKGSTINGESTIQTDFIKEIVTNNQDK